MDTDDLYTEKLRLGVPRECPNNCCCFHARRSLAEGLHYGFPDGRPRHSTAIFLGSWGVA